MKYRRASRAELARLLARLDALEPYRGPCGICGGPDQRHRLWDAVEEAHRLKGIEWVRKDWTDLSLVQVRTLRAAYDEARRLHAPLPGRWLR